MSWKPTKRDLFPAALAAAIVGVLVVAGVQSVSSAASAESDAGSIALPAPSVTPKAVAEVRECNLPLTDPVVFADFAGCTPEDYAAQAAITQAERDAAEAEAARIAAEEAAAKAKKKSTGDKGGSGTSSGSGTSTKKSTGDKGGDGGGKGDGDGGGDKPKDPPWEPWTKYKYSQGSSSTFCSELTSARKSAGEGGFTSCSSGGSIVDHAEWMAKNNNVASHGPAHIVGGAKSIGGLVDAFMSSSGHRANITGNKTDVKVGCYWREKTWQTKKSSPVRSTTDVYCGARFD